MIVPDTVPWEQEEDFEGVSTFDVRDPFLRHCIGGESPEGRG